MVFNIWMKLFRFFSEVEVNILRATRNSLAYLSNRQISNKSWSNRNSKRITEFVMPWDEVIIFGLFSKLTVLRCSLLTKLPVSAKIMRCSQWHSYSTFILVCYPFLYGQGQIFSQAFPRYNLTAHKNEDIKTGYDTSTYFSFIAKNKTLLSSKQNITGILIRSYGENNNFERVLALTTVIKVISAAVWFSTYYI